MPGLWQTFDQAQGREKQSGSPSATGSAGFVLAGMPFRARALRDTASAAITAASAKIANSDAPHLGGTLKGLWTALSGYEDDQNPRERCVLLQPGWAVKRPVHRCENGGSGLIQSSRPRQPKLWHRTFCTRRLYDTERSEYRVKNAEGFRCVGST